MSDAMNSTTAAQLAPYPRKPPVLWTDWAMVVLAFVSVGLIVWITFFDVSPTTLNTVLIADAVICAIFAAEFLWRWRQVGWHPRFLLVNWYEILGMIPAVVVTSPIPRAFRIIRIGVALARLARAIDRIYGDRITAAVVSRTTETVVDAVKRPITIAVLDEVADVLKTGHYTKNITSALEENKPEMAGMILETIKNDPQTKRIRYIPFHDEIIQLIVDTTFRMVLQVLADERTDELVADVLRENIDQIRDSVKRREAAETRPQAGAPALRQAGNTVDTARPAP